ncbi:hypothetical protein THRCLA_07516 [Thraustotheca clavata]|uniref:Uncharacterized protein n=1 Tax=Thraustotheca clavata TaxID=74557 RepID=A0A1V9ZCX7_9STRA|nr:hypothetical protein THRCLA_07516 [Thraustotheca clavata]
MSVLESISKAEKHVIYVTKSLEKLRAEHNVSELISMNASLLTDLREKQNVWRKEWKEIQRADEKDREEVLLDWSQTKKDILDQVAKRTEEVDQVKASERQAMHILREWNGVRKTIAHKKQQVQLLEQTIERQEIDNSAKMRLVQQHAEAIESLRWEQLNRQRMLENEKLAAEESIVRRKFWLRAGFLISLLFVFGMVMIALDRDRKKGSNLRLYDYQHQSID